MKASEQLDKLFEALSKAQGEMGHAEKNAINPHFKNKYADLAAVFEAVREPLSKNGLSIVQIPEFTSEGRYNLKTILGHSSGQFIETDLLLLLARQDMQGLGSAITYAKRYVLSSMIGIAQDEDDDGNAASTKGDPGTKGSSIQPKDDFRMSDSEWKKIAALRDAAKMNQGDVLNYIAKEFQKNPKDLNRNDFDNLCAYLNENKKV
jgi:hypothetical protein